MSDDQERAQRAATIADARHYNHEPPAHDWSQPAGPWWADDEPKQQTFAGIES